MPKHTIPACVAAFWCLLLLASFGAIPVAHAQDSTPPGPRTRRTPTRRGGGNGRTLPTRRANTNRGNQGDGDPPPDDMGADGSEVPPGTLRAREIDVDPFLPPPGPTDRNRPTETVKFGERNRIKRTVAMRGRTSLADGWDELFRTRQEIGYLDWDDNYLYLAVESAAPRDVRFDLDAKGDGWLRGADNIAIQITLPRSNGTPAQLTALRLDAAKDKDNPTWSASPIAITEMRVAHGRTARGTYAIMLALPRTDRVGLPLEAGKKFALRVDSGLLPPLTRRSALSSPIPLTKLVLANHVPTANQTAEVRLRVRGRDEVAQGQNIKATLEVRNHTKAPLVLSRLFVRGSKSSFPALDEATLTNTTLKPGETLKRDIETAISPNAPYGTLVLTGGLETERGQVVTGLAAFDHVPPYSLEIYVETKPVPVGERQSRTVRVTVRQRARDAANGDVTLEPPPGWAIEDKKAKKRVTLTYAGAKQTVAYKVVVPDLSPPGIYLIEATLKIGGQTYNTSGTLAVTPSEFTRPPGPVTTPRQPDTSDTSNSTGNGRRRASGGRRSGSGNAPGFGNGNPDGDPPPVRGEVPTRPERR